MMRSTRRACMRLKTVFSCFAPGRRPPGSRVSSEALLRGRCSVSTAAAPEGRRFNVSSSDSRSYVSWRCRCQISAVVRAASRIGITWKPRSVASDATRVAPGDRARQGSWPLSRNPDARSSRCRETPPGVTAVVRRTIRILLSGLVCAPADADTGCETNGEPLHIHTRTAGPDHRVDGRGRLDWTGAGYREAPSCPGQPERRGPHDGAAARLDQDAFDSQWPARP